MTSVLWKVLFIQAPDPLYRRGRKLDELQNFLMECFDCKTSAIIVENGDLKMCHVLPAPPSILQLRFSLNFL